MLLALSTGLVPEEHRERIRRDLKEKIKTIHPVKEIFKTQIQLMNRTIYPFRSKSAKTGWILF